MTTIFASFGGFVTNTAVVDRQVSGASRSAEQATPATLIADDHAGSGLGGQIGELAAAINAVGWNHNQVPADERLAPQERLLDSSEPSAPATPSGLGGQIGELTAAINAVGWNHNQVPAEERLPPQERL